MSAPWRTERSEPHGGTILTPLQQNAARHVMRPKGAVRNGELRRACLERRQTPNTTRSMNWTTQREPCQFFPTIGRPTAPCTLS